MPVHCVGYAAMEAGKELTLHEYMLRDCAPEDVLVEVAYCGICHTDLHMVDDDWHITRYPVVPGHEFTGVVCAVGTNVTKWKLGDRVGVGYICGSCGACPPCEKDAEQYCPKAVATFSAVDARGDVTYGGYGRYKVLHQDFVVKVPDSLPMDQTAPLLCAGITMWSPLAHNGLLKGGKKVAIVGLGGLGHLGVMLSKAMGNETWAISRSHAKDDFAKKMGAVGVVASSSSDDLKAKQGYFDYILDSVSDKKDINAMLSLLAWDGVMTVVGLPETSVQMEVMPSNLIFQRKALQGSLVGSVKETQQMLDFCALHNILPMCETVTMPQVNQAYERVRKNDVRFRFVLDVKNTLPPLAPTAQPIRAAPVPQATSTLLGAAIPSPVTNVQIPAGDNTTPPKMTAQLEVGIGQGAHCPQVGIHSLRP